MVKTILHNSLADDTGELTEFILHVQGVRNTKSFNQ